MRQSRYREREAGRASPEEETPAARTLFDWHGTAGLGCEGPDADWRLRPVGELLHGDATIRTTGSGLVVESGAHRAPGAPPEFGHATGPGGADDHLKWCALVERTAASGLPGFDAPESGELTVTAWLAPRVFGAGRHPFGDAVTDSESDARLAAGALIALDPYSGLVFDFFLTNRRIHAVYERLYRPGDDRAAFSYLIPVADRSPGDGEGDRGHLLEIAFERSAGTVTWRVDGKQVLRVGRLGCRSLGREHLAIDHGGVERPVVPRQLVFGLGLFTLLDAAGPDGRGLVRLSPDPDHYVDPALDDPVPQRFWDEHGRRRHRLWGQGVRLTARRLTVAVRPALT
ncbi:DUF6081 family protein [Streptomyces sp. NPDC101152]|uniref:DUF6081 family protein n=1 Tax=Streptomyces sp. NPDC101152 TaxID=3366116 RepID=UPI003806506F